MGNTGKASLKFKFCSCMKEIADFVNLGVRKTEMQMDLLL